MNNPQIEEMLKNLAEIKNQVDEKQANKLDLSKIERIINRLDSFSHDCLECNNQREALADNLILLKEKLDYLSKNDIKVHHQKIASVISHLQKEHKLVTEAYYLSLYMSIGMSIGLVFGLTIFDNLALGLPLGMGVGVVIGSMMDSDAKEKGLTL